MFLSKETGLPIVEGLTTSDDVPHTISNALLYRARINSFQELPKDKRPPRDLWDKPHQLEEFFDEVFDRKDTDNKKQFIPLDESEIE